MDLGSTETTRSSGLKTVLDTVVAPKEAFERLRTTPTWGWAFLITLVLYAAASYLMMPAIAHATQASWPQMVAANPTLSALTPAQQQTQLDFVLKFVGFSWAFAIVAVPIVLLFQTIVMTIFKAAGRGDAGFGTLWAVACNVAVPALGISAICAAIIVVLRGPDAFDRTVDVAASVPSLGMIVPAAAPKLHAFLSAINPFTLWGCALVAGAMIVTARVSKPLAWATGIVILAFGAGFASLGAR